MIAVYATTISQRNNYGIVTHIIDLRWFRERNIKMNDEPITCIIPAGSNVLDVIRNICPSYFDDMKILLEAIKEISQNT